MNTILQDLRYALRSSAHNPGFAVVVVVTLALGIGLNAAMFNIIRALSTRVQQLHDPASLVLFWGTLKDEPGHNYVGIGAVDFQDWRTQAQSFAEMAVYTQVGCTLTGDGEPERARAVRATPNLLPMLGIDARIGGLPRRDEDAAGAERVVILTDRLWRGRYAADPGVLGRTVLLDGAPHTIVGILPPRTERSDLWYDADLFTPLRIDPVQTQRGQRAFQALGRLKPGVVLAQAQAEMEAIAARLAQTYPTTNADTGVWLQPIEDFFHPLRDRLGEVALLAAVGAILLMACVNLANLQLARTAARSREFAIRAALGAGRSCLVRQLLTESLVLALLGGGLGLVIGWWAIDLTAVWVPDAPFAREDLGFDPMVLVYALLLTVGATLTFGLAPALSASRVCVSAALKEGPAEASTSRQHNRLRSALVVVQLAAAVPLLVCCGLVVKHLVLLRSTDVGFDTQHMLTMRIDLPAHQYGQKVQQAEFYRQTVQALQAVPGVERAAATTTLPFGGLGTMAMSAIAEGRTEPDSIGFQVVTPDYFRILEVPLLAGRFFTDLDHADAQRVALVNERLVETYWPRENAIGKRLCLGDALDKGEWVTVVGVVADRHYRGLGGGERRPEMYFPHQQGPRPNMVVVARTVGDPLQSAPALRAAIAGIDTSLPVSDVRTAAQVIQRWLRDDHLAAGFTGGLAVLALGLACVGLFGVVSYSVEQRRHEIGVRVALGAGRRDILRLVLRRCLALAAVGILVGLALSVPVGLGVATNLYGVRGTDPLTLALVTTILLGVALLAGYVPARRATKVDPMVALRCE